MLKITRNPTGVGSKRLDSTRPQLNVAGDVSKTMQDLKWQIQFTEMKLTHWQGRESRQWEKLVRMHDHAKRQLSAIAS